MNKEFYPLQDETGWYWTSDILSKDESHCLLQGYVLGMLSGYFINDRSHNRKYYKYYDQAILALEDALTEISTDVNIYSNMRREQN